MDYLNLILAGYSDANSREHLQDYFYVEYKKAEQQFYSTDLFFGGCLKVIEFFESDLKKQLNEYKKELYEGLRITTDNEAKAYFTDELNNISMNNFFFNLHHQSWPSQYLYFNRLQYSEIQNIKKAILETEIKVNSEQIKETTNEISELESIDSENIQKNQLIGFTCTLHPDTVKEIYIFMVGEKYLSGHLNDFKAMFSKVSIPVETPVKWLIKNERGTNPDRGNQTALFVFLELILKKVSNQDLIKSKDLFIDEKGKFIKNKLLRPDKDKINKYGFETQLKDILKKADQPKNQ